MNDNMDERHLKILFRPMQLCTVVAGSGMVVPLSQGCLLHALSVHLLADLILCVHQYRCQGKFELCKPCDNNT